MKKYFLFLLLITTISSYAQKIRDKIQGDWVCTKVLDINGNPTSGKFGESSRFLRFSFYKNSFSISETPFDKGLATDVVFKNDNSFDWLPKALYDIPERIYMIKELNGEKLVLSTKAENGDSIYYHFKNLKLYPPSDKGIIDNGKIIIKHIHTSKTNSKAVNRYPEYQITNDPMYMAQRPIYTASSAFGMELSVNIQLPQDFKMNETSQELILDFDVSENGADNLKIVNGLSDEINKEVIRVVEKLRKNWKPLIINGVPIKTTMRFHLYFYTTFSEVKFP